MLNSFGACNSSLDLEFNPIEPLIYVIEFTEKTFYFGIY